MKLPAVAGILSVNSSTVMVPSEVSSVAVGFAMAQAYQGAAPGVNATPDDCSHRSRSSSVGRVRHHHEQQQSDSAVFLAVHTFDAQPGGAAGFPDDVAVAGDARGHR